MNEQAIYKHTQTGWLMMVLIAIPILVSIYVGVQESVIYLLLLSCFFIAIALLFYKLTVVINDREIKVYFGIGLIKKVIEIKEIESSRIVRNKWYWGWGLKKIPGGWMYNIAGLDAVEIEMHDGRKFRVGTDEQQMLNEMIQNVIRN
ncbi:hypothetical protein JXI42_01830 [bacterium]|nr:hypothetical protein [bacterium]